MKYTVEEQSRKRVLEATLRGLEADKKHLEKKILETARELFNLKEVVYGRTAKFVKGDVVEYQRRTGWGSREKIQTRRLLFLRYKEGFIGNNPEPFWKALKKDMTISMKSYYSEYVRDSEISTMRKVGTWDFEKNVFVPLEEKK